MDTVYYIKSMELEMINLILDILQGPKNKEQQKANIIKEFLLRD